MKQKKRTARGQSLACLVAWANSGKAIQGVIDRGIHGSGLSTEDRHLALNLVLGVIRWQGWLDEMISRFSTSPLRKMQPLTLMALRLGLFQLCFLDRIPPAVAVHETVAELKRQRQPQWLLGFVNATLRTLARHKDTLLAEVHRTECTHPAWLLDRWKTQFGPDKAAAICRINQVEPQLCLHSLHREEMQQALLEAGQEVVLGNYAPNSLFLPQWQGSITALPGFEQGLFHVQDQAAQLACHLLAPFQQGRYLDACAGQGGKTLTLANLVPAQTCIQAVEPDAQRCGRLQENLLRQHRAEQVQVFRGRLEQFAATQPGLFTGIFLDVPCSGTGVIRRKPDIRWNRHAKDLLLFQQQQLALLDTAARLLAPGGILVYATCSLEPEENQEVIEKFLAKQHRFQVSSCRDFLPPAAATCCDAQGFFAPSPSEDMDGFFAARLVQTAT
jgi:16S rRNA (cytosine967-C5)-methyltransferase